MATKFYARAGVITKGNSEQPPKSGFDLERLLKFQLTSLNVPFNDDCCTESDIQPVGTDGGSLVTYDPTTDAWIAVDLGELTVSELHLDDGLVTDLAIKFGADGNNGLYGVSDTVLGVAVEGAQVATFTTTNMTVNGVTNIGGTQIAAFYPQVAQNNIVAGAGGAIAVTNYLTTINTDAGGDAFTLANGTLKGQMKKILLVVDGGGDGVATPATAFASGATTATFNDAGDYLILQWNGTAWRVQENFGVTVV